MDADLMSSLMDNDSLWVFAYGSLLWKPCFQYERKVVGHIKGCKRRFYQGNTNLRGTTLQPGRVAILMPDQQEVTWGVAYEIRGQEHVQHALQQLFVRENDKGGYHSMMTTFHPRVTSHTHTDHAHTYAQADHTHTDYAHRGHAHIDHQDFSVVTQPFLVLAFTATSDCPLYLGPADMRLMARQVVAAQGQAGPNWEYVVRTAEYVRRYVPEDDDQHLFQLDAAVRELLAAVRQRRSSVHHHDHVSPAPLPQTVPVIV